MKMKTDKRVTDSIVNKKICQNFCLGEREGKYYIILSHIHASIYRLNRCKPQTGKSHVRYGKESEEGWLKFKISVDNFLK